MKRRALAIAFVAVVIASPVDAASRARIRAWNIGGQSLLTLANAALQKRIHSPRDVVRVLTAGAVAGGGFYEAKVRIADGHIGSGWLIANVAASVAENTAAGLNPLARIGYTVGPFRVRAATPLDRGGTSFVYVDASLLEAGELIVARRESDRTRWRAGMIAFTRNTLWPVVDGVGPFNGRTFGIYPALTVGTPFVVWNHEAVHSVQSLQGDSAEPPLWTRNASRTSDGRRRLITFDTLRAGAVTSLNGVILGRQRYEERWTEIEAYRMAQNVRP
jgi:hypothetical protein